MGAVLLVNGQGRTGFCGECSACQGIDSAEWLFCYEDGHHRSLPSQIKPKRRKAKDMAKEPWVEVGIQRLEELTWELFRLHDLNGNDLLEENELITLNEKIAILHHGKDTDTAEVRCKYRDLFRAKFDPEGKPVPYPVFRAYAKELLNGLDTDPEAQEMILEQFVAEARSGRQAFDLDVLSAFETRSQCPTVDDVHALSESGERCLPELESISPMAMVQPQPLMLAPHPWKPKQGELDNPSDESMPRTSTGSDHLGDTGMSTEKADDGHTLTKTVTHLDEDGTGSQGDATASSSVGCRSGSLEATATTTNSAQSQQETPLAAVKPPPCEDVDDDQRQQLSQAEATGADIAMAGMPGGEAEPVAIEAATAAQVAPAAAVASACAEHIELASSQQESQQERQQQQHEHKEEQEDAASSDIEWGEFRAAVAPDDIFGSRFSPREKLIVERRSVRRSSSAPPAKKRAASSLFESPFRKDSSVTGRKAKGSQRPTGREATVG